MATGLHTSYCWENRRSTASSSSPGRFVAAKTSTPAWQSVVSPSQSCMNSVLIWVETSCSLSRRLPSSASASSAEQQRPVSAFLAAAAEAGILNLAAVHGIMRADATPHNHPMSLGLCTAYARLHWPGTITWSLWGPTCQRRTYEYYSWSQLERQTEDCFHHLIALAEPLRKDG